MSTKEKAKKVVYKIICASVIIILSICIFKYIENAKHSKISKYNFEDDSRNNNAVNITENWDLSKVNIGYDSNGNAVPIPKGYVVSSLGDENH